MTGLAFGAGVAIVGSLWGECDWGNNDVDIDVERYNNINGNNRINVNQNKWQHNSAHRNGVPYRDNRSREQYGRQLNGASQREAYRGDTPQRAQQRENARSSMDRAGIERPPTTNREARDQARDAQARGVDSNRAQGGTDRDAARQNAANRQRAAERQSATDRQQASNRGQGTDRNTRPISNPGNRPLMPDSARVTHRRAKRRKVGRPRRPPVRAVPATMHSPARAHRPKSTHKPIVAGPARHPPSAPMPRDQPASRSVGRPIHQRVKVKGVAVVE